ncbi:hypothetical protein C8046_12900 [Serinibacter arcticus]|uniref:Metallo-beta-lactamase domain-containing protein n=1 Tax=Serinibacter arcticus TaxID=1655435 RepID=A0A2U1ZWR2_9MICO|nr:MBL fold metallo-hydrolase [Serinibacter arcticus]PWD51418.1 hypothetical protein C8046_12900 [Serinibacter arcticus]
MTARIERVLTHGTHPVDGREVELDNNVWIVGDDTEVVVIDASHQPQVIADAIGGRRVVGILLTHGHRDHIGGAPELERLTGGPVWLHPADAELWEAAHPEIPVPTAGLPAHQTVTVAGTHLEVRHTPGHTPGASVVVASELGAVFTGDTLFEGGPGATRWEYSSFPQIVESITENLLTLPEDTVVHTGHGPDTTIGAEAVHRQEWIDRGW